MEQKAFEQRFAGVYGPGRPGRDRLNEACRLSDIVEIAARVDSAPLHCILRIHLDLASQNPFFQGSAAAHVALDLAGSLHRLQVREGAHDWIFRQDALPSVLEHVSRNYSEWMSPRSQGPTGMAGSAVRRCRHAVPRHLRATQSRPSYPGSRPSRSVGRAGRVLAPVSPSEARLRREIMSITMVAAMVTSSRKTARSTRISWIAAPT